MANALPLHYSLLHAENDSMYMIHVYIYTRLITHNPPETKNSKGSMAADLLI